MQNFPERLVQARNAKNMTQEALAKAVSVTRSTVSSWERGRTEPGLDMVQRLSEILDCDLVHTGMVSETPAGPASPAPQAEVQPAPAPIEAPRRSRLPWLIAIAAVLVCVAVALLLSRSHKAARERAEIDAFIQRYSQVTDNEAGKAYVTIEKTRRVSSGDSASFDLYTIILKEQNGIAFDIDSFHALYQRKVGADFREINYSAADLQAVEVETHLDAGGETSIDGGFPQGEFLRAGIEVHGTDENGAELTFTGLIDFTVAEDE